MGCGLSSTPADAATLQNVAVGLGLEVAQRTIWLKYRGGSWTSVVTDATEESARLLVLARHGSATDLLNAELENTAAAGAMLGYPACCVHGVLKLGDARARWPSILLEEYESTKPIDARVNRFAAEWGGIGLIGEMFPCSLRCRSAIAYSQSLYNSAIELGLARLADAARADALKPVFVSSDGVIQLAKDKDGATTFIDWT